MSARRKNIDRSLALRGMKIGTIPSQAKFESLENQELLAMTAP